MRLLANLVLIVMLVCPACATLAPSANPEVNRLRLANEAIVAIGTVQHAAIQLNAVQTCTPTPCHPILSDHNTGVVVDVAVPALVTLKAATAGPQAVLDAALAEIEKKLDAAGKRELTPYLRAARAVLKELR